jgi:hypothetical protein
MYHRRIGHVYSRYGCQNACFNSCTFLEHNREITLGSISAKPRMLWRVFGLLKKFCPPALGYFWGPLDIDLHCSNTRNYSRTIRGQNHKEQNKTVEGWQFGWDTFRSKTEKVYTNTRHGRGYSPTDCLHQDRAAVDIQCREIPSDRRFAKPPINDSRDSHLFSRQARPCLEVSIRNHIRLHWHSKFTK